VAPSCLYKIELTAGESPRSWLVDLWRSASLPRRARRAVEPVLRAADAWLSAATAVPANVRRQGPSRTGTFIYNATLALLSAGLLAAAVRFVLSGVGIGEVEEAAVLGLATAGRVMVLLLISTLIWTPIAVAIGFNPRLARVSQPVVQILASFPANFFFPFATIGFIRLGVSLNWGSMLLMALGAQWYLLFNVIGGAQSIPNDLREMAASIGLRRSRAWTALIGPGIFGSWVTGAITASGGAWNASIVAELVHWGHTTLKARGLGAYIAEATAKGDWPRIVLGVGLMSVFVVTLNRAVWRPLYDLSESKYRLG
jgi:NitT/TauT family transport system permease protein